MKEARLKRELESKSMYKKSRCEAFIVELGIGRGPRSVEVLSLYYCCGRHILRRVLGLGPVDLGLKSPTFV